MKKMISHIKIYITILLVCYVFVALINYYFNTDLPKQAYVNMLYSVFMYVTSIYLAIGFLLNLYLKKTKIANQNTKFAIGYWIALLTAFISSILIDVLAGILVFNKSFNAVVSRIVNLEMFPQYIFVFVVTTAVYIFLIYKLKQEKKVREHKIVAQSASAKFETLKSQIDPHFLFNSLNVLSSLIEENPEKAQEFTIALSKTYRYVLEQRNKDLVSLSDEFVFAKTFIKLLKLRFEDALEIDLPIQNFDPDAKVVPLVLQLILENAVKHNVINSENKLIIKISIQNDILVVKNNLQPKNILQNESTGFGLSHIVKQYKLVSNRNVLIKKTETDFTIYLPILTKQLITEVMDDYILNSDEIILKRAKNRLKELKNFYISIVVFIIFTLSYFVFHFIKINNPMKLWMPFAIVIYAVTLIIQAATIFGLKKWEQKMMYKLMKQYKDK